MAAKRAARARHLSRAWPAPTVAASFLDPPILHGDLVGAARGRETGGGVLR